MYLDFAGKCGSMGFCSALSGLELALWAIAGNSQRTEFHVYANGWSTSEDSPEETARKAALLVEPGFIPFGTMSRYQHVTSRC